MSDGETISRNKTPDALGEGAGYFNSGEISTCMSAVSFVTVATSRRLSSPAFVGYSLRRN